MNFGTAVNNYAPQFPVTKREILKKLTVLRLRLDRDKKLGEPLNCKMYAEMKRLEGMV